MSLGLVLGGGRVAALGEVFSVDLDGFGRLLEYLDLLSLPAFSTMSVWISSLSIVV